MAEHEHQEAPFHNRRFKNPKLRRGIFLLPSLFTVANLLCGYYASVAALVGRSEDFDHAAKAIGIAILFDSLDGRIARMTGTNTEFGVQFDSIADVVSFGIAPAIVAYAWGYRNLPGVVTDGVRALGETAWLGDVAWLCCLTFLICSAWRLARFNVQGMAPGGSKNFVGMPTPAAAGVVAAIIHACHWIGPITDKSWAIAWFVLMVVLGALMTSTVRYYSFKDIPWARKQPSITIILLCLLVGIVWKYSEFALVIFAVSYAVAGVVLHIVRVLKHRMVARTV
ncbi:MAG TPA: phosphatidylcholine/phosphatidylserine synthase [Candidatus Acidoferrum sp.]|jgi:CDP-diacylglycerol--serine O-phosphatidyltransferase